MRAALALLAAGCWTGAASDPAPMPQAARPLATSPYEAVAGEWSGTGIQYDTMGDWPFVMQLRSDAAVGEVVGKIEYPTLHCTSELIREPEERGTLVMTERLTSGAGLCVDQGTVRFSRRPHGGKLDWRWYQPDGSEGARSVMTRVK